MRKLDVNKLLDLHRMYVKEYEETALTSLNFWGIHIDDTAMEEIAPIAEWSLNIPRNCETYPYEHTINVEGVKFFCITAKPIEMIEKMIGDSNGREFGTADVS